MRGLSIKWLTLSVVAALLLAGCTSSTGEAKKTPSEDPQSFDDFKLTATKTTGIIRGVVYDEAIRPLPDVSISTTGGDGVMRNTTTNKAGLFGFDGLEAGTYFLQVSKVGYLAVQYSVDVVAGQKDPPIAKISLRLDEATKPRVEVHEFAGFIACSITAPVVSFAACGLTGVSTATNNKFLVEYNPDVAPTWIQSEAIWKSTNPFGDALSLSITDMRGAQTRVNATSGTSPIYIGVNETRGKEADYGNGNPVTVRLFSTGAPGTDLVDENQIHNTWRDSLYGPYNSTPVAGVVRQYGGSGAPSQDCIKYPTLFNACLGWGGVGVVINQGVTVFTHIFYGYQPPSDWRFSTQGAPPAPK
jgi:hypothetical protein